MSRIDQALKRASEGQIIDYLDESPAAPSGVLHRAETSTPEEYPGEGQTAAVRSPRGNGQEADLARLIRELQSRTAAPTQAIAPSLEPGVQTESPRSLALPSLRPVNPSYEGKLVTSREVSPVAVKQYGKLAAAIQEIQDRSLAAAGRSIGERGLRTLLVTSALPGEGRTLTVANLALTLSETYGRHVLVIDADLRHPSIHDVFGISNEAGLGDLLHSDRAELPLREVSGFLSLLPAGAPDANTFGALASHRMRTVLEECAARFDWVLLDGPPVSLLPDRELAPHLTRAVLFVIGGGSTPYSAVEKAIARLGRGCLVGSVLNRGEERRTSSIG